MYVPYTKILNWCFWEPKLLIKFDPESISLLSYHHCLSKIKCNRPLPTFYLAECACCPGVSSLRNDLITLLEENLIDSITFKQWVSVDRCTLETYTKSVKKVCWLFLQKTWCYTSTYLFCYPASIILSRVQINIGTRLCLSYCWLFGELFLCSPRRS